MGVGAAGAVVAEEAAVETAEAAVETAEAGARAQATLEFRRIIYLQMISVLLEAPKWSYMIGSN
jgi:hypothetical protein